ncbi:MAG: isopentenyl-diphosphate Delta-isomerase [Kineosporiaceae bacterium]
MTAPEIAPTLVAPPDELVVLLDDDLKPCGTALKRAVHHRATPLHLAFSCWVLDETASSVLLTRRAAVKHTFPGLWTNAFCGHPGPGEPFPAAIARRAADELGVTVGDVTSVLPDFRYVATMPDGTMENEFCPVFTARLTSEPAPNPDEVDDLRWVALEDLPALLVAAPEHHSPWMREQWSRGGLAHRLATG